MHVSLVDRGKHAHAWAYMVIKAHGRNRHVNDGEKNKGGRVKNERRVMWCGVVAVRSFIML